MRAGLPALPPCHRRPGLTQGPRAQGLAEVCRWINVEIVKRSDTGKFIVLPKR
jgi:hypothetical protein